VESHEKWIEKSMEKMKRRLENHREPTEEEEAMLRKRAAEYLPAAVEHYSSLMGLKAAYVKITSAKTRLGSCGPKNGICFSWRLMQYPKEAIDYVVVHELAHTVHKNHGKLFYKCIEEIMPDYKERRALLKG
jgi:predicted metal-dependent hydrolase